MASVENYKICLQFVLCKEGGYSNHKSDNGGETNFGIADKRDGKADGLTDVDGDGKAETRIKDLTPQQAGEIYWREYWLKSRCDRLPKGVDLSVFDIAVNCGPRRAAKFLQEALEFAPEKCDGKMGPLTISAAELGDAVEIIRRLAEIRRAYYRSLDGFLTFGKGWLNRTDACEKLSLELAK